LHHKFVEFWNVAANTEKKVIKYLRGRFINETPSSPGLEPKTDFRGCGLCSCNLLAERNNSGLGAVSIMLSFRATETTFTGTGTQDAFSEI
jgi:hypothetical protein